MSLLELFVDVDDFCQTFLPVWEKKLFADGSKKRRRAGQLSTSEIMTIIIYFHQSRYRNFKAYYTEHVCHHLRGEFPNLVSYERFVVLMPSVLGPLSAYLKICMEVVAASPLLTQPHWKSVIIIAFTITKYLKALPSAEKAQWAGFTA
jgi:hypothetical protein